MDVWILIIVFVVYLLFRHRQRRIFEGLTGSLESEIQVYVDNEFTKYYRPVESGYLYLLTVVSKDSDFVKLAQNISPANSPVNRCLQQQVEGTFVPGTVTLSRNRGWFDGNGSAYIMTPPRFDIPPLDSDEISPQNTCSPDPKLLKLLAEQIILINTQYKMIPFFINSSKYGVATNISALPLKGMETYIFTLNIMTGIGQSMIDKLKNMGKTIDVAGLKAAAVAAEKMVMVEPFADNCCKPASQADLNGLKARAATLVAGDGAFQNALKLWNDVEKQLRGLYEKLNNGFTAENLKEFGFNEADFTLE